MVVKVAAARSTSLSVIVSHLRLVAVVIVQ